MKGNFEVSLPPPYVGGEHCSNPYKLVVTITYLTACGKLGPIAGFVEGPMVQFEKPA